MEISVIGDGIAGLASVAALEQLGIPCRWLVEDAAAYQPASNKGPQLVLNDVALSLLNDLFSQASLAAVGHQLTQRLVAWDGDAPQSVAQQSLSISAAYLRQTLTADLAARGITPEIVSEPLGSTKATRSGWQIWTKSAARLMDDLAIQRHSLSSGRRNIYATTVKLSRHCDDRSYTVESTDDGWMILIPHAPQGRIREGTLQWCSVTEQPLIDWLSQSRLIAPLISSFGDQQVFNVAPTIGLPMCGQSGPDGWLIAGEQAANLDPISGEGTPFSIRSGILAAAVVEGIYHQRIAEDKALMHYQSRLSYTFIEHLKGCVGYYRPSFGHHPAWQQELARAEQLASQLSEVARPEQGIGGLRLVDGRLVTLSSMAEIE